MKIVCPEFSGWGADVSLNNPPCPPVLRAMMRSLSSRNSGKVSRQKMTYGDEDDQDRDNGYAPGWTGALRILKEQPDLLLNSFSGKALSSSHKALVLPKLEQCLLPNW